MEVWMCTMRCRIFFWSRIKWKFYFRSQNSGTLNICSFLVHFSVRWFFLLHFFFFCLLFRDAAIFIWNGMHYFFLPNPHAKFVSVHQLHPSFSLFAPSFYIFMWFLFQTVIHVCMHQMQIPNIIYNSRFRIPSISHRKKTLDRW